MLTTDYKEIGFVRRDGRSRANRVDFRSTILPQLPVLGLRIRTQCPNPGEIRDVINVMMPDTWAVNWVRSAQCLDARKWLRSRHDDTNVLGEVANFAPGRSPNLTPLEMGSLAQIQGLRFRHDLAIPPFPKWVRSRAIRGLHCPNHSV
jgi:hypothetical protein